MLAMSRRRKQGSAFDVREGERGGAVEWFTRVAVHQLLKDGTERQEDEFAFVFYKDVTAFLDAWRRR